MKRAVPLLALALSLAASAARACWLENYEHITAPALNGVVFRQDGHGLDQRKMPRFENVPVNKAVIEFWRVAEPYESRLAQDHFHHEGKPVLRLTASDVGVFHVSGLFAGKSQLPPGDYEMVVRDREREVAAYVTLTADHGMSTPVEVEVSLGGPGLCNVIKLAGTGAEAK